MKDDLKNPLPIEAAGGVAYKYENEKLYFLLIYRNGVWDLPKGKKETGETFEECAVREFAEETNSELPKIINYLTDTVHTYEDKWGYFIKTTKWYLMKTKALKFSPQTDEGIEKVCWIEADKALQLVGYDNLKVVVGKALQKLNS